MKNIQKQYQDLLEGKMSKSNFMRNVRMQFPQHISSVNSFEDSVKILKGKRILSETKIEELLPSTRQSAYDKASFQASNAYQQDSNKKLTSDPLLKADRNRQSATFSSYIDPEVIKKVEAIMRGTGDRNVEVYLTRTMDEKNEPGVKFVVRDNKGGGRAEFEIKKDTYKVKSGEVNNELVPSVRSAIEYIQNNELKDPVKKVKSLTELTSVSDKEIQSAEFDSLKNIQKDYLSNHPLSIQPTSFSGDKGSSLKLTGLRWYNNKDNTFGFTMTFNSSGNRDEYIDVTFYKDKQNNPVKNIRLTDKIQGSWKEYKDDIVGYLNKAMRSAQVDGRYVDSVITALSRMTPEKIGNTNTFNESNIKELGPDAQQMAGNPEEERASRITMIRRRRDNDKDAEIEAMIAKAKRERDEEEGIKGGFGIQDPLEESYKDFSNNELASYVGTLKNELNAEKDPKKAKMLEKDLEEVKAELEQRRKAREKSLNEAKQPIGVYGHNPNAEAEVSRGIDHLNYYQVYKGLQYELAKMPEITDANYIKARKKVVDTILKDSDAYKNLQLANFKAVKEMDEDLKMKDVKKDNLNDKPNEMKVMKKDEKGNTQDTLGKKENRKSKTAKIPVMTQAPKGKLEAFATPGKEKVMALKEHILDELTKPNETKEYINKGSRVKKKGLKGYDAEQVGNVIDFDGDTATVIWDKHSDEWEKATAEWNRDQEGENPDTIFGHHIQVNVLTKKDIPEHPKAKEKFGQIPDSPFMKKEEESKESKLKGLKEKLMKTVKEMIFKKDDQMATASTPQSQNALKRAGYTPVPNTKDVKSL